FHAFELAAELERRGFLERLITSYPLFGAARFGISRNRVKSVLTNEIVRRGFARLPPLLRGKWDADPELHAHYERHAVRHVPEGADLLVAWSGSALAALRRARALGMATILERGSSHISYQTELLVQEYG